MWPAPVVILLPFVKRVAGIGQRAEERLIQTFIAQLSIEAFDERVLLRLSWRNIVPTDANILNPFEDRHAGELGSIVRHNRLWHAGPVTL